MSNKLHIPGRHGDVLAFVGQNLRAARQKAGLSQAALAEASGLSRRMIVALEQGDTNISLSRLDRLAEALGVGFVDLVRDPAAQTLRLDAVAWRGRHEGSVALLQASVPARHEAQLWAWTLAPGERYDAEPDPEGWHEMIVVVEGRLRLELAGGAHELAAGDYLVYPSSQTYAYVNAGEATTRFIRNVVA